MIQLKEISGLERFYMYSKCYRAGLETASSLERVPDYRGFGLQRFRCTYSVCCTYVHTVLFCSMYPQYVAYVPYILRTCSETSLNRTIRNLEPSLNWVCFQVLLSIFAVHIEPV